MRFPSWLILALSAALPLGSESVADGGKQVTKDVTRVTNNTKVGRLIRQLDLPGECLDAMVALGELGEEAAPAAPRLASFLRDANWMYRANAVVALHGLGEGAVTQIPALVRALGDKRPEVSAGAFLTLQKLGVRAVPGLVRGLNFRHKQVRRRVAETLGQIGRAAQEALPALRRAASDPDPGVSRSARRAIKQIQKQLAP
jgi:HEAT repeat protein